MIRYALSRLLDTLPTLAGIILVSFVVTGLSMNAWVSSGVEEGEQGSSYRGVAADRARYLGLHLPLLLNLELDDARSYAEAQIVALRSDRTAPRAERLIVRAGGAWLPYLIPALENVSPLQKERLLDALDGLAPRIGLARAIAVVPDRAAFWRRYWETYGADFTRTRAAMLVRRVVRRKDRLALTELKRLDTYALPQLLDAMHAGNEPAALRRITELVEQLTGIRDPLVPGASTEARDAVLARWHEWWYERADRYTVFDGFARVTGAFTETRLFRWVTRVGTLDFGVSLRDGRPISAKLTERLPVTLLLSVLSLLVAYLVAIPLGIVSAVRRGGVLDRTLMAGLFVVYSLPTFMLAMVLLRMLSGTGYLDLFPAQGLSSAFAEHWPWHARLIDLGRHLILPVFCLSAGSMAMLARYQRVGMLQVIDRDYMRTARAKGFSRLQAILRHGLRNSIIPLVTMLGLQIPYLVSGSVVVERIFGIPGMGLETFEAIRAHDQPWLMAAITVTALMTMIGVVLADVLYALVDPRIAPGQRGGRR